MQIYIRTPNHVTIKLNVDACDTINLIKAKIQDKQGTPQDQQRLTFIGQRLDNVHTLSDYSIQNETSLDLVARPRGSMHIFVQTETGATITLDMEASDTIANLKARIQEKLGLFAYEQRLIFAGNILDDGRTLRDCSIQQAAWVQVQKMGYEEIDQEPVLAHNHKASVRLSWTSGKGLGPPKKGQKGPRDRGGQRRSGPHPGPPGRRVNYGCGREADQEALCSSALRLMDRLRASGELPPE